MSEQNTLVGEWNEAADRMAVHFSTGKDDWATPPEVFDPLHAEFRFVLDAAANSTNHKCAGWLGPDHVNFGCRDGLAFPWAEHVRQDGAVWVNPPYSRNLQPAFIAKAAAERLLGATTVMLLPARTDTKVFHEHIWNRYEHAPKDGIEVRFLKGRVRFVGAPASAPFPSMIVVFRP